MSETPGTPQAGAKTPLNPPDHVSIYKWMIIRQDTPWNVQLTQGYAHMCDRDFTTLSEAEEWAKTFNLPIIYV
jgi:hypothetical protein